MPTHMQVFSVCGLISGLLFILAIGSSFVAIALLDSVAIATGIWCGIAMVASFIAGAATGERLNVPLAVTAMLLMIYAVYRITSTQLTTSRYAAPVALKHASHHLLCAAVLQPVRGQVSRLQSTANCCSATRG